MIGPLLKIFVTNLRRDRVVQAMAFLLPVLFFSIFALVFGQQRDPTSKVSIALVDEDQTEYSRRLAKALSEEGALSVRTHAEKDGTGPLLTRETGTALVKDGIVPVTVVLPKGLQSSPSFGADNTNRVKVQILSDPSDPIAPQMVLGLLQKVGFTAAPDVMADQGMAMFEKYGGGLTAQQRAAVDDWKKELASPTASSTTQDVAEGFALPAEIVNVMQANSFGGPSTVSFYAAGVGVMFLLFSCSGAGGSLLDEEESGTLGRLLGSRAGMNGVLAGKFVFIVLLAMTQMTVMFLWAALAFQLPLASHLAGFAVMTFFTAAAAASFGLVLATISRSRAQLSGISTILILTMSALGGSMFPRFFMSETMQKIGLVTFNAWALDGYIKVFWRNAAMTELWPQVLVLSALTVVFLTLARFFARRWETL
ncbi:MAG: ABC transporter permease [Acidobacteria bacterium]|nr:MAG: ABC transporter permease [Acidobacteriota bacterium]